MAARLLLSVFVTALAALFYAGPSLEPFGQALATVDIQQGPLVDSWRILRQQLKNDDDHVALCVEGVGEDCAAVATLVRVVTEAKQQKGLALIGHLNRSINLLLKPAPGVWMGPLAAIKLGSGDCKAYAVAKYFALREAGESPEHIRLVIVDDRRHHEDHIVAAVYQEGRWLLLDNMTMALVADSEETDYVPLFVLDDTGVRQYYAVPGV